jgi:tetratricopeptide (TPR) repeat protein
MAGRALLLLGIIFSQTPSAFACGPNFPNEMLDRGDEALLAAPIADFDRELLRIRPLPADIQASLTTNGPIDYTGHTIEADVADLRGALRKAGLSKAEGERIVLNYQDARVMLARKRYSLANIDDSDNAATGAMPDAKSPDPAPGTAPGAVVPDGLPGEFADYFRGCIEWSSRYTNEARATWESLLERPAAERHYRSTWAAYMLGKYWQGVDDEKSTQYFQQVQALAAAGFTDRLGLAGASVGWEAKAELHQKHFDRAIQLYFQQLAAGDRTATVSLRLTAGKALGNGGDQLASLAANAECRRLITAYIISRGDLERLYEDLPEGVRESSESIVGRWLDAVEAANITDVESAEQLALAAYQSGQWQAAQRWLERAKTTPVTEWLGAKLLLRSGKVEAAAALLEKVARDFPLDSIAVNPADPTELKDNLHVPGFSYSTWEIQPPAQVRAELGALQLARREYVEALDALLRSGYWMDAAYVAERVLTVDELKNYVDQNWPAVDPAINTSTNAGQESTALPRLDTRQEIRYLLARKLMRMERGNEAQGYYPAEQQADFAALMQNRMIAGDGSSSPEQRSAALFAAAKLMRLQGMELVGTEDEPDWGIHGGGFQDGISIDSRTTNDSTNLVFASADELDRARQQGVVPNERFHYRYQAAELAWEAAALMPNNSDETARVLCIGGSWLKYIDPQRADVFYKSLVRRCRKTDIGQTADRMRWFPLLDENGKLVPWEPKPPEEVAPPQADATGPLQQPVAGYWYVVHRGNSLQDVLTAARAAHQVTLTVEELGQANHDVSSSRLKPGMLIFVPAPPP